MCGLQILARQAYLLSKFHIVISLAVHFHSFYIDYVVLSLFPHQSCLTYSRLSGAMPWNEFTPTQEDMYSQITSVYSKNICVTGSIQITLRRHVFQVYFNSLHEGMCYTSSIQWLTLRRYELPVHFKKTSVAISVQFTPKRHKLPVQSSSLQLKKTCAAKSLQFTPRRYVLPIQSRSL